MSVCLYMIVHTAKTRKFVVMLIALTSTQLACTPLAQENERGNKPGEAPIGQLIARPHAEIARPHVEIARHHVEIAHPNTAVPILGATPLEKVEKQFAQ